MIAPDVTTAVSRLRELIEVSDVIVPFTGAGISTECGIPDFRSPGGIWTKMKPIPFDDFLASQRGARRILAPALRHGRISSAAQSRGAGTVRWPRSIAPASRPAW